VTLDQLKEAYNEAKIVVPNAGTEGYFFEAYWHAKITELSRDYNFTVLRLSDKRNGSMLQFKEKDQYWVPGNHTFPQIHSAIACNKTLYAMVYTIGDKALNFDVTTFSNYFLANMFANSKKLHDVTDVIIVYVVSHSDFKAPEVVPDVQAIVKDGHSEKLIKRTGSLPACPFGEKVVHFATDWLIVDVNSHTVPTFPFFKKI
jgi:hypothetical protein